MSIEITSLGFTYMKKTPYEKRALDGVSLTINDGEVLGIVGSTGSGKTTFVQHLNGLIKTEEGRVVVFDVDLSAKKPDYRKVRGFVGMVFQYPEYQLFEETVALDVAFGPKNQHLSEEEIARVVREAVQNVGLDFDEIKDRSPFELSGGQKRRVAIAGIIAMRPRVLVLDEPTCGLDPRGKKDIIDLILRLKREGVIETVVVISHDMDEISTYTDRLAVFHGGKLLAVDTTASIFAKRELLEGAGLTQCLVAKVKDECRSLGVYVPDDIITIDDFVAYVASRGGKLQ